MFFFPFFGRGEGWLGLAQQMVPSRYRSTYIELTLCHVIKITFVPILFVIQADLKRRVPGLVMMNRLFFFVDSFVNLGCHMPLLQDTNICRLS